ncbi:MAG: hypothetical protein A2149_06305 [Candidatus Schekmanbacteria bacterium RBG_16_38_11]|uniref:4Fe-4S Mo/W bis-MGD-type domain-containing protein n=1 Tax=Candidatus Schekmanbacteria bacterium RBG_16_38_11 TaxID=1817880 RepID=A0A1F7RQ21_9BACT|nr:MAG: hypothetical protein A2149_06305 [Candidatus Schekmanbacteria bacterium RBG_16_38_11]
MMKIKSNIIKRRTFLKALSGTSVGLAFSSCNRIENLNKKIVNIIPAKEEEIVPKGVEKWMVSTCGQCKGGCGIKVRLIDERAVKIEGNLLHPINQGSLCPKGQAGLQLLYDPDRLKGPLKRKGERGGNQWEKISWDEAAKLVVEKLKKIRTNGEAHQLAFMSGKCSSLMKSLSERFLESFGSPNYFDISGSMDGNDQEPSDNLFLTQGIRKNPAFDLVKANLILSFGSNLLESFSSPVQALQAYGYFRRGRTGSRAKLIQIDSRLSVTGAKADEWIPINPGTLGALALGLAYIIIKEDLYDKDFISENSFGFEDFESDNGVLQHGFKRMVLNEYSPGTVSKITGVSIDNIIRLAREFATNKPAIAISGQSGIYDKVAIHSLNALCGSIDTEGGILTPQDVPLKRLPSLKFDEISKKGLSFTRIDGRIKSLIEASLTGKPYKINALFIHNSNPLFTYPDQENLRKAFEKIPFILSFSCFLDETSKMADLILPDHTYLEKWEDAQANTLRGYPVLGIRQPVLSKVNDTMHTGDFLLKVAKGAGGAVSDALPWDDFKAFLSYSVQGVYEDQRGNLFGPKFEEAWVHLLEKGGWSVPAYSSFEEFWNKMLEKGGWWDPIYYFGEWNRIFNTPSGKFEFYFQTLKKKVGTGVSEKDYPFYLNIYKLISLSGLDETNQPWLQGILAAHVPIKWNTWVEINPEIAKKMGISEGDLVWVESRKGKIIVYAHLYQGAMPKVVNIPFGLGHSSNGRWIKGIGKNPVSIMEEILDPLTGNLLHDYTRVKIYKV